MNYLRRVGLIETTGALCAKQIIKAFKFDVYENDSVNVMLKYKNTIKKVKAVVYRVDYNYAYLIVDECIKDLEIIKVLTSRFVFNDVKYLGSDDFNNLSIIRINRKGEGEII